MDKSKNKSVADDSLIGESPPQNAGDEENLEINQNSYRVKLSSFEGPLDLLLFLIKKAKIDICDIFVSQITEQYLEYMKDIDVLNLDMATEFIEIAACLIEIKSKSLLPKPAVEEQDEDDPKRMLMQRIEEYKLYKDACQKMKEQETVGLFYREPDDSVGDPRFVLRDMTMDGLMKALQKMFLKLEKRAITSKERKITLDRFTVAEKIEHIKDALLILNEINFFSLFEEDYSKSEIISTFQAMLELIKMQFMTAVQENTFSDILLTRLPNAI